MADDTTHDENDGASIEAAVRDPGSLRQRMGYARFNAQVRDGLAAELERLVGKPAGAKKHGFRKADVPLMMEQVTDDDINTEADLQHALGIEGGGSVEAADAGAEGNKGGPIKDWFVAHPELVNAVIAALLKKLLGV